MIDTRLDLLQAPDSFDQTTTFPSPPLIQKMNKAVEELKFMSQMRFESPEPESRQGRRNIQTAGVQLLDTDGGISLEVSRILDAQNFCSSY